ncbi:hypothetical protein EOL70_15720 [Leucothrix sargassi]|nr:hypothetical protein EOL70_15720 [Leucothrix sargassi]
MRRSYYLVGLLLSASVLLTGCEGVDAETEVVNTTPPEATNSTDAPPEPVESFNWAEVSGQHTKGMIPRNAPIKITFNRPVVTDDQVGKSAEKFLTLTPSIEGQSSFVSSSELVFVPDQALTSGAKYQVEVLPKGLVGIPTSALPYRFDFSVIPFEYEVKTNALYAAANTGTEMTLTGELLSSDRVMPDDVKKMFKASYQGKTLPIEWQFSDSGKRSAFTIPGVTRETFATDVKLSWDSQYIGIEQSGTQEIAVPMLNEFEVIDMAVLNDDNSTPYVQISFTEPLDTDVNLQGLVQIKHESDKSYTVRAEGSRIKVFPKENLSGDYTIIVNPGVRSESGLTLSDTLSEVVAFDVLKPKVAFIGDGSILPPNSELQIPFKAVAVNAVEVSAFQIYPDNVGQFLQTNSLNGDDETARVGRYLWRKTLPLNAANYDQWNEYSIDVSELMKGYNGSLIRLELSINPSHTTYECAGGKPAPTNYPLRDFEDNDSGEDSGWDGISYWQQDAYDNYVWMERNDPCKPSYYLAHEDDTNASSNFIASNIGLIAKQDGHGNLHVVSTDIREAKPLTGVELEVRNYQGQVIAQAVTDGKGFADVKLEKTPFLLVAKKLADTAYLKLNARTALTVSHFDVGGSKIENGLKGSIYGERGVWRPGDEIYLTFALFDKDNSLPANHPVNMQLIDPRGRVTASKTSTDAVGDLYPFIFKTNEKDPTGTWLARASLGGSRFTKSLSIETVRPNRLKVELDFGADTLYQGDGVPNGVLSSQWLHGATAEDLKTDIAVRFSSKPTTFTRFSDYSFDDPTRNFSGGDTAILEGRLDKSGQLKFAKDFSPKSLSPGMLSARFTSRVFENSGAFSISQQRMDYHPYENYVGVKLPKGDAVRGMLLTDTKHKVQIGTLSAKGEPVDIKKVRVSLFKVDWKWWWDKSPDSLAKYADSESAAKLQESIISTVDGSGEWEFEIKYPEWGRYLVRACDINGKHCGGQVVYVDWPGWAGRAQEEGSGAASRLNLFSDKSAYMVGDTATIQLPAATEGRALLSVETGSDIISQQWVEFTEKRTQVELPITADMAPNAYVHVTLLQPHKDKQNERPLRLYGIIPIEVANPDTYLKPVIQAEEEWKPESTQKITVTESNGKAMNYTLAVVDEGLLGLTNFQTPNLHRQFYLKEALGVKTWDLYDSVIGAYNGSLERMLAIGGGNGAELDADANRKRRFPPVVKMLGPFSLKAGETATHDVELPAYIGAVRLMLVAANEGAFGRADKEVFVRQPLMMQASLPRVLGTQETFDVPVTLFVTDENLKDVTINVETDDLVDVVDADSQTIRFDKTGEQLGFLRLKTGTQAGKARLKFTAVSGENRSESELFIDVRQPNSETTRVTTQVIEPGSTWQHEFAPYGLKGTNSASIELSAVPALNLERHLNHLVRYPHGCLEQTTSAAFPQLYLTRLMDLSEERAKQTQSHVSSAVEQMRKFQNAQGDFNYWQGGNSHNAWASVYAGHFLVEAQKQGYLIPPTVLSSWLTYQSNEAQRWELSDSQNDSHTQAYRLYVLAVAGKAEMSAMNRLRESVDLSKKARWMLASAYQTVGQPDAATSVIQDLQPTVEASVTRDDTFSSTLGDMGIQLQNLVALEKTQGATVLLEEIAAELGSDKFQSTQGIAWALMGASRYLGDSNSQPFKASYTLGEKDDVALESTKPFLSNAINATEAAPLAISNTSGVRLYASVISKGVPALGDEQNVSKGLSLDVNFSGNADDADKDWGNLPSGSRIVQGTDVKIEVTVKNDHPDKAEYLALTIPVAAGWEVLNDLEQPKTSAAYDHRDQRDDRVHFYFDLAKGEEKTFSLVANTAYLGQFYVPAIQVQGMYDGDLVARTTGRWVRTVSLEDGAEAVKKPQAALTIKAKQAILHDSASEESATKMYVITGDTVTLLSEKTDDAGQRWYQVRFEGSKIIEKWIKAETTE